MKNKKGLIALSSVVAVCALGLILSPLVDWAVDSENTSGNIAKSSRFSRKTATESLSNMEELLANDPQFKSNIVTAYVVMQTRAQQFSSLVDMSNEVAGDIPEFAGVLDEMNKVYVTVNNVCASLVRAGENINASLNGEKRPDLAQNTMNASLAYTTLQKQNKLANEFIDVTDKYIQSAQAEDELLFVRDQWVDYQLMTAALEGDEKSTEVLEKKGALLSAEKSAAALGSQTSAEQTVLIANSLLANSFGVSNTLANAIDIDMVNASIIFDVLVSNSYVAATTKDALAATTKDALAATTKDALAATTKDALAATTKDYLSNAGGLGTLVSSFTEITVAIKAITADNVSNAAGSSSCRELSNNITGYAHGIAYTTAGQLNER